MQMLRSEDWVLENVDYQVPDQERVVTLDLDLPEIGVRDLATVTGVEPSPAILPGPGMGEMGTHRTHNLLGVAGGI